MIIKNDINNNINNHGLFAILDKREDEAYNVEPSTKLIDYPHIEPNLEPDCPIEPDIDISNYSHIEPTTEQKHHSKQKNETGNLLTFQMLEPSDIRAGLRNLFSST